MIRFTDVYTDDEIAAIVAESDEDIDLGRLKDRKIGKYGITVQSSSSSPTVRYANFMNVLEIARMYPERVPAEAVIERSDLADKEKLMEQLVPPERQMENEELRMKKSKGTQKKRKIQMSKDFVNVVKE
jgi:hypothetical protein